MDIPYPRESREFTQKQVIYIQLPTMTAWASHQELAQKVLRVYQHLMEGPSPVGINRHEMYISRIGSLFTDILELEFYT